jgi:ribosomal protein L31E
MSDNVEQTHASQKFEEKVQEKKGESIEEKKKEALIAEAKHEKLGEKTSKAEKKEKPKAKEEKKDEKKREIVLERIITVPFLGVLNKPRASRYNHAMRFLRAYVQKQFKTPDVKISVEVGSRMRTGKGARVVRKIKLKATKDKEGVVWLEIQK